MLSLLPGLLGLGALCLQLGPGLLGFLGLGFQTIQETNPLKKLVFPLSQIIKPREIVSSASGALKSVIGNCKMWYFIILLV